MRFNSLRVEQGVDHLISPLDGAMPVNLKEMNLKQLKALTSILTDLSKVNTFQSGIRKIGRPVLKTFGTRTGRAKMAVPRSLAWDVEKIFSESASKAGSYAKTKKKYVVIFQ